MVGFLDTNQQTGTRDGRLQTDECAESYDAGPEHDMASTMQEALANAALAVASSCARDGPSLHGSPGRRSENSDFRRPAELTEDIGMMKHLWKYRRIAWAFPLMLDHLPKCTRVGRPGACDHLAARQDITDLLNTVHRLRRWSGLPLRVGLVGHGSPDLPPTWSFGSPPALGKEATIRTNSAEGAKIGNEDIDEAVIWLQTKN